MKLSSILIPVFSFILIQSNLFAQSGWFQQVSGTNVNLHSINFSHGDDDIAWTCGDNGVILHTTNGGANWIQQISGTTNDLYSVCFMEGNGCVMAVGDHGTILRTTNDGNNWIIIASPTTKKLRDISDFNMVAVGDSGTIIKSSNSGVNWFNVSSPVVQNLNGVSCTFSYYAVGDNGTILKGFSGGTNWQILNSGTSENLNGVPLFGSADITTGSGGLVWRSTNNGISWFGQNSNTNTVLRSVEYSINNTAYIYICGNNGTIIKSTNYGTVFGFQNTPTNENLNSIFFYLSDNFGYSCGNNGTILKTTNGGGTIITSVNNTGEIPLRFHLEQNYPNPFNPSTKIKFNIPNVGSNLRAVILNIYDISGRLIMNLLNENLNAGIYEIEFDASQLSSGAYFYRLTTNNFSETKKMILIK